MNTKHVECLLIIFFLFLHFQMKGIDFILHAVIGNLSNDVRYLHWQINFLFVWFFAKHTRLCESYTLKFFFIWVSGSFCCQINRKFICFNLMAIFLSINSTDNVIREYNINELYDLFSIWQKKIKTGIIDFLFNYWECCKHTNEVEVAFWTEDELPM